MLPAFRKPPGKKQQDTQIIVRYRVVRMLRQDLAIHCLRLIDLAKVLQDASQVAAQIHAPGFAIDCSPQHPDRLFELVRLPQRQAKIVVQIRQVRVVPQCFAVCGDCLLGPSQV